jgi:two-component system, chemotaxis family, sensor kinase CheA
MMSVLRFLVLPSEITDFERRYLARVNRVALAFFAMHLPVFALIAWCNGTRPGLAALLCAGVLVGPAVAYLALENPRRVSMVHGVAAMFMGGLLVHFGQGPMQIEMHFYFFALVAMCAVFGNPMVIVAAAVTVALHHLVAWLVLPRSVFNYDAAWWVVAVHAAFVVLESVAMCFISRSFFDNVIGLERIVEARTRALDAKNADLRMLLDNVQQGLLTIDLSGRLAQERSAAADRWFGGSTSTTWFDRLSDVSPAFADASRFAWGEVTAGIMPMALVLEQMPHRLSVGRAHLHVDYRPIGAVPHQHFLVVVTDVTTDVERERAETERRETMAIFEQLLSDRTGFELFIEEGTRIIDVLTSYRGTDRGMVKRMLHTLKGNAGLCGLASIADLCHELEDLVVEGDELPPPRAYDMLFWRWGRMTSDIDLLLGQRAQTIEIDEEHCAALEAAAEIEPRAALLRRIRALRLEPTEKRLAHFAEQAQRIAERLGKGPLHVRVEDHGVRLPTRRWAPFWSELVHAVRNAVDHGIETPEVRKAAGKPPEGTLSLRTYEDERHVVVEIADDRRGIDWGALAEKAAQAGLPAATRSDLERALFMDGMSTTAAVTDVSGRGVGMGALLYGTHALGGDLAVESAPGRGTTLRMTFPVSASAEDAETARSAAA